MDSDDGRAKIEDEQKEEDENDDEQTNNGRLSGSSQNESRAWQLAAGRKAGALADFAVETGLETWCKYAAPETS